MEKATIYSRRKHRSAAPPVHHILLLSAGRNWECLSIIIYQRSSGESEKNFQSSLRFVTATMIVHTHTRLLKFAFDQSDAGHDIYFHRTTLTVHTHTTVEVCFWPIRWESCHLFSSNHSDCSYTHDC